MSLRSSTAVVTIPTTWHWPATTTTSTRARISPALIPKAVKVVRLFNPRRQSWTRHFSFDGAMIVGRTQCGRATVVVLALNAHERVDLRAELIADGVFPPVL